MKGQIRIVWPSLRQLTLLIHTWELLMGSPTRPGSARS